MQNKIIFSLIVATLGRVSELEAFLESIVNQSFSLNQIEVILIDQNKEGYLNKVIEKFKKKIPYLVYVHSKKVGVSFNRNYGLSICRGEIVAYPDDDCIYYPDTLQNAYSFFSFNSNADFLLGSVFCRELNRDVIRRWPKKKKHITTYNFLSLYTMITIFTKLPITFDEKFGGGALYKAYEDADFVFNHLKYNGVGVYDNEVQVMHPELNINSMNDNKITDYSYGFGAFCKKNNSAYIYVLFNASICYHFLKLLIAFSQLKLNIGRKHWLSILSRIKGWYDFES